MKFKRIIRATVGGFLMLVMTFTFLPALVINPEITFLQNFMEYINKE